MDTLGQIQNSEETLSKREESWCQSITKRKSETTTRVRVRTRSLKREGSNQVARLNSYTVQNAG